MCSDSDRMIPTGRGTRLNQSSRFEATEISIDWSQLEHDDDLRDAQRREKTQYFEDMSRSVISENDSPDIPYRYSLNPYRGCLHGCSYCYARPSHEYFGFSAGLDFETKIFVKKAAPRLFHRWLCRRSYHAEPVMMSGVTDCYQPVERALNITRQCLAVAAESGQPMTVITKNALIRRDLDLLTELARRNLVRVSLSITSLDQSLTRVLEPRTSSPRARIEAIQELSSAGVPVHVMIAPIIPGLNDSEIPGVLEACADAGARSASHILVRLPHSVKDIFSDWLQQRRPDHAEKVLSRLAASRGGKLNDTRFGRRMRGTGPMAEQISQLFAVATRRYGLDQKLPPLSVDHFLPPDRQRRLF